MTEPENPLLTAALAYAARGWHVFPCAAGLKLPRHGSNGWQEATTDPGIIRAWWAENPRYNVAIATGPSGLAVLDVDPKGMEHWERLAAYDPTFAEAVEAAPKVTTPRGGWHAYMAGDIASTASRLAPGIDTRGAGGYVLAPPSFVSDDKARGSYVGDLSGDPLPVPAALLGLLVKKERPKELAPVLPHEIQWDNPEALERARGYLQGRVRVGDVAIEGQGGDLKTFEIACAVLEMGITPATAFTLLDEIWNPHCQPPWDSEALKIKIHNAWKYGQDTKGGKAERPLIEEHAHLVPEIREGRELADEIRQSLGRLAPIRFLEGWRDIPDYRWLVDQVIPEEGVGVIYGRPGTLKTFLALDLAMSVATGYGPNWWEGWREPASVIYMAGESPQAFRKKRMGAWLAANPLPGLEQRGLDNFLGIPGVPRITYDAFWRDFPELLALEGINPSLIVVDTLQRAMIGMNENTTEDMGKAMDRLEALARRFNCFVLVLHHQAKTQNGGSAVMRGSGALEASVDTAFELVREDEHIRRVKMYFRRQKEADIGGPPWEFEGVRAADSIAMVRDRNPPAAPAVPATSGPGSEAWLTPATLWPVLSQGPHTHEQLAVTLSQKYEIPLPTAVRVIRKAARTRLRAWCPDGEVWRIPEGFPMPKPKPEEF